ncbi:diuretic hormone receptor-like [Centruroides vittatus]|uniref:diuretic hormone receptor-like n=1 Tax=Centruroides vittatus TaxID=120091 RepID=UPI00350FEAB3
MTFLKKFVKMESFDWGNFTVDMIQLANNSYKELSCYLEIHNKSTINSTVKYCNNTWDGASCWPMTPAQTLAVIPCFYELRGVYYDVTQNATRMCEVNGTWAEKANYSGCRALLAVHEDILDIKYSTTIYYIGYSLSLIALILALSIFLYFKDLRCLRNTIHTNLMITYILNDLTWIITATLQSSSSPVATKIACLLIIMLTYLMGTNFFWMFVEGLYLYILVVKTFSVDMVKFSVYLGIGWGLPVVIVIVWVIVKSLCSPLISHDESSSLLKQCFWQNRDIYDYIFISPVIIVLVINIYFLAKIMWVLITKLRAATSVESQQYRKASKALLVLIPLLGITYVLVIVTPNHGTAKIWFAYFQAALLSTQGFTVAVLYCFLNGEVRNTLRHFITRRRIQNSIGSVARPSLNSQQTETLRLYPRRVIRDQDSLATTDSWISNTREKNTNEHRPSNGCYNLCNSKDDMI